MKQQKEIQIMNDLRTLIARLAYLITEHQVAVHPVLLEPMQGLGWLGELHKGIAVTGINLAQLRKVIQDGSVGGKGSRTEIATIVFRLGKPHLSEDREALLRYYTELDKLAMGKINLLDDMESTNLGEIDPEDVDIVDIPKFTTGFEPIDLVTDGLYQGLCVIMGHPGSGKTTFTTSLMQSLAQQSVPVAYFQNELAPSVYKGRVIALARAREIWPYTTEHTIHSGTLTSTDVLEYIGKHENKDRVVIYDSPDLAVGISPNARFDLAREFLDLTHASFRAKAVITTSQANRAGPLELTSFAESWTKAWVTSIVITVEQIGMTHTGMPLVQMSTVKNRFGPLRTVHFNFDYATGGWSNLVEVNTVK